MNLQEKDRLAVVILAAGEGKRMKSGEAKVLAELCGSDCGGTWARSDYGEIW